MILPKICTPQILGAFHYAKDFGNLGWNSNGKVYFSFFPPEYSGSPLKVYLFQFFALIREFGRVIKSGWNNSYCTWLARFNQKMSFHFPWEFPLISDQSVCHNGKHPLWKRRVAKLSCKFLESENSWRQRNVAVIFCFVTDICSDVI